MTGKVGALFLVPWPKISHAAITPVTETQARLQALSKRCTVLLIKLAHGMPYISEARNQVPRRMPLADKAALQILIDNLKSVGTSATVALAATAAEMADTVALQNTAQNLASRLEKNRQEYSAANDAWTQLNVGIPVLNAEVQAQRVSLLKAEATFQAAIIAAVSPNCNFASLVSVIGAIVSIADGGATLIPALNTVASQLSSGGGSLINLKEVIKKFEVVSKDINSIAEGFKRIRDYLDNDSKGALLVIKEQDLINHLEAAIKSIQETHGPSDLDKQGMTYAVRAYAAVCQARNSVLMALDATAIKVSSLQGEYVELEQQYNKLQDALNNGQLVKTRELGISLRILKLSLMKDLRDYLWSVERAADYYMLRSYVVDVNLTTDEPANLFAAISSTINKLETYRNGLPGKAPSFPVSVNAPYTCRIALTSDQGKAIDKGAPLLLVLQPELNAPPFYKTARCVYAEKVRVTIDGRPTFKGVLRHLGPNRFLTLDNRRRDFLTVPGAWAITQDEADLGAGDDFLGLSPYSDWQLEIEPRRWPQWAFSHPQFVELTFSGQYRLA